MKILVTGGTGFIGRYLCEELQKHNYEVIVASRSPKLAESIKSIKIDLTNYEQFKNLPSDFEAIFNLCVFIPPQDTREFADSCFEVNIKSILNLLEFAKKHNIKKFIHSSSLSVFGNKVVSPVNEDHEKNPTSFYGMSKLVGEHLCDKYIAKGIDCVVLRYPSVYGFGQSPDSVIPIFINRALKGERLIVYGEGKRAMDFVYVKDVVLANLLALKSGARGIFNIGLGKSTTSLKLARKINRIFGENKSEIVLDKNQEEEDIDFFMDITKAKKELGYKPQYNLEAGLKDYKEHIIKNEKSKIQ